MTEGFLRRLAGFLRRSFLGEHFFFIRRMIAKEPRKILALC
jgi:hypothetical protein